MTTRTHEDELLVIADVSGIDHEDVTVGFSDTELVVVVTDTELERVDVPWPDRTGQAAINNGVLTVQVRPDQSDTADDELRRDSSTESRSESDSGSDSGSNSSSNADSNTGPETESESGGEL